jgi:prevent-host-death family protein
MKGAIAEAAIQMEAVRLGFVVLRPQVEGRRYDLVIDTGPRLLRLQCKWAVLQGNVVVVRAATSRHTPHGYVRSTYTAEEIDGIGVYCQELDRCYYLPAALAAGRAAFHLRLAPAANYQEAAINWAADYEFGAIAQLGERSAGSRQVGGSSPPSSIALPESIEAVGSHQFREHLGRYLDRVRAGRRFILTRHGTPFARVEPVEAAPAPLPGLAASTQVRSPPDAEPSERADQRPTLRLAGT